MRRGFEWSVGKRTARTTQQTWLALIRAPANVNNVIFFFFFALNEPISRRYERADNWGSAFDVIHLKVCL